MGEVTYLKEISRELKDGNDIAKKRLEFEMECHRENSVLNNEAANINAKLLEEFENIEKFLANLNSQIVLLVKNDAYIMNEIDKLKMQSLSDDCK